MRHVFLINPAAGKRDQTDAYRARIEPVCRSRGLDYTICVSREPGDCRQLARQASAEGGEVRLYACGGDGTLNEVVAGAAGFDNAAVTHFAGGSGNDFVRMFDNAEAFRSLEALLDCREERFDLIHCNDAVALNVCCVGLDARVGGQMAVFKRWPLVSGSMSYILSAVVNTIRGITEEYSVSVNGETFTGRRTLVYMGSGQYYGGGFHPMPYGDPGDGKLDVLIVGPVTRLQVLAVIDKYKKGRFRELPELVRHIRTDRVTLTCPHETCVNLDGEITRAKALSVWVEPRAVRFFCPKNAKLVCESPALAGK